MSTRQHQNGNAAPRAPWQLDRIVAELRASRAGSQQSRKEMGVSEMPSREAVRSILDGLFALLFPAHFGQPELSEEGVDYFVGQTLDATLRELHIQIQRELQFEARHRDEHGSTRTRAFQITRDFAAELPKVRTLLEKDIHAAYEGDPAAKSIEEVRFCYPGITAVTHHRLAHELYRLGAPLLARIIAELAHSATGIDIHPGAQIGESFFIDHGSGVVIGETAIIGNRVRLYQAVTLGAKRFPASADSRTLIKGIARHPIVEDDVVIYSGATILGRITIGHGSTIGGNVWITRDVPPDSLVTQALNRSDGFDDGGGI
jgi:serine O-acetyltransferase